MFHAANTSSKPCFTLRMCLPPGSIRSRVLGATRPDGGAGAPLRTGQQRSPTERRLRPTGGRPGGRGHAGRVGRSGGSRFLGVTALTADGTLDATACFSVFPLRGRCVRRAHTLKKPPHKKTGGCEETLQLYIHSAFFCGGPPCSDKDLAFAASLVVVCCCRTLPGTNPVQLWGCCAVQLV